MLRALGNIPELILVHQRAPHLICLQACCAGAAYLQGKLSCKYNEDLLDMSALWCRYPILNKPWVLSQWFKIAKPTEEYFLVLDSDMIIHRPFLPEQHQVGPGMRLREQIQTFSFWCISLKIW